MLIACAAAQVSVQAVADFVVGGAWIAGQDLHGGQHHARSAEPALQAVLLPEAFLDGMKFPVSCQTLDGQDLRPVRLDRQKRAGLYRHPVEDDRTGAATRGVAADVCTGESEDFPQIVHQQKSGLDLMAVLCPVDPDCNAVIHGADVFAE